MTSQTITEDLEAQEMIRNVTPKMTKIEELNNLAKELILRKGYKVLNSEYFTSLRNKRLFYRPLYFYAAPGEKVCVIDILLPHGTLKDKSQFITKLEMLNRDCKEIRSILLQEYHNCSRVFNDQQFGYDEFRFLPKRVKLVPYYNNALQAVFSIKPIILTIKGDLEYDLQPDSRVDVVPIVKIQWYLDNWGKEVVELAKKAYNLKKFRHYEAQSVYEKWILFALFLYLIPTELNIFLQWDLWFLSFYFFLILISIVGGSTLPHNYIRYKRFATLCKQEITTSKWVVQCSYLKPFLTRSRQLLVQPLEDKQNINQTLATQNKDNVQPLFSNVHNTNSINSAETVIEPQRQVENRVERNEIANTSPAPKELIPETPLIKPSGSRGIKTLLQRTSKPKANITIYKEQIGDLYSKMKTTSDFEVFRIVSLRIIGLILTCEWFKRIGNPPVNIRIRDVSNDRVDHFRQVENLLTQFLERLPDVVNIDEMYRFATIINMGQMNQKMFDHIEWKVEDWLLHYKLLPDNQMKVLKANHSQKTGVPERIVRNYTDKVDSTLSKFKTLAPEQKAIDTQEEGEELPRQPVKPDIKAEIGPPSTPETTAKKQKEKPIARRTSIIPVKREQPEDEVPLKPLNTILNRAATNHPDGFIGEQVKSYDRFIHLTTDIGYITYGVPVCILAYDSRIHYDRPLEEFKQIAKQMPEIAYYIYYDFADTDSRNRSSADFNPLLEPRIWVRDKVLEIDKNFKFSNSSMANFLSGVRRKLKNKDAPDPSIDEFIENEDVHGFNQVGDEEEQTPDDLGQADIDEGLPENISQAAKVYETEEYIEPDDDAMKELEEDLENQELDAAVKDQEIVVRHGSPFLQDKLFKPIEYKNNGIVIDSNNILHTFFPELNKLKMDYGYTPDYYLIQVFDALYRYLVKLGFGPIIFFADPDFYIYFLPEPDKNKKIQKFDNKRQYMLYTATREEHNYFENQRGYGLFRVAIRGIKADEEMLPEAYHEKYKILSNDQFGQSEFNKYREYIAENRLIFRIDKTAMMIYDATDHQIGEPFFLIDLPEDIKEKVISVVRAKADIKPEIRRFTPEDANDLTQGLAKSVKLKILERLSSRPMSTREIRNAVRGKNKFISEAIQALADDKKIKRLGRKWALNSTNGIQTQEEEDIETSLIEIVFGAFHVKIGPIILFPPCGQCIEKVEKDKAALNGISEFNLRQPLKLTNCKCPLPKTGIPRDIVRNEHLNSTLKDSGFHTSENDITFLSYRWVRKEALSARQELSWAILIYMNHKNSIYNIERNIIGEFLRNYDFNIDTELKALVDQGLKGEQLDDQFYEVLYKHLMNLINDLTAKIHNNLSAMKE